MAAPELLEWCLAGGVSRHGLEAGYVAEGWRGVLATQDIPPGTCVLRVPRRLLMSVESAGRDADLSAALQQCGVPLNSEQVLAIHLLHEASKGSLSFWYPYLRSLPRSYTTAMCFTDSEAAALQAAHAMAAARAAAAAAAAAHAGARPALRALRLEPKWRRLGAWLWAASTLSSRTMYLPFDSAGALTPFGDLHNYRPPPPPFTPALPDLLRGAAALAGAADGAAASIGAGSTAAAVAAGAAATERRLPRVAAAAVDAAAVSTQAEEGIAGDGRLDEDAGEYCIHARIRYAAGDQVFLCYGRHTNLELLQHYGFVLPGKANPHDTAALPPQLLPSAVQQQLAGAATDSRAGDVSISLGSASDGDWQEEPGAAACYLHASGAPSWDLLRALRLGCATSAERRSSSYLALQDQAISPGSERGAFEGLKAACEAVLAALPTTLQQDEQQQQQLAQQQQQQQQQAAGQQDAGGSSQQAAERLAVALEWRLGYKRILQRGIALCDAVLATLPAAAGAVGVPAPGFAALLAAMQRKPRW